VFFTITFTKALFMKQGSRRKSSETLRDKVQRHLHDKNDIITDEDIRDAIVGENDSEKASRITDQPSEHQQNTSKKGDEIPQNKNTTPWDVLSEGYD